MSIDWHPTQPASPQPFNYGTNYGDQASNSFFGAFALFQQKKRQAQLDALAEKRMEVKDRLAGLQIQEAEKELNYHEGAALGQSEGPALHPGFQDALGISKDSLPSIPGNPETGVKVNNSKPAQDHIGDATQTDGGINIKLSSYTPGKGNIRMEGGKLDAHGRPAYTMEQFQSGNAPHVTVAMDPDSPLQGKMLTSPKFPGIKFKVSDTGDDFKGKGNTRMDVAWSDPAKQKSWDIKDADFQVDGPGLASIGSNLEDNG